MRSLISLDDELYREPGLYLLFDDGLTLTLTHSYIEKMTERYLNNPDLLPRSVRQAESYAPCYICPKRETAKICHAIPTVFPFLEDLDRFLSYDTVTAVFRPEPGEGSEGDEIYYAARTSMQRALRYISILSLLYYCEVGRIYYKYFAGIVPFASSVSILERVYLRIYWDLGGDQTAIKALIKKMRHEIDVTVHCQMERLRLFCQNDGFLNAFANTHFVAQFLDSNMEKLMRKLLDGRIPHVNQEGC